jgi:hypothetical protein
MKKLIFLLLLLLIATPCFGAGMIQGVVGGAVPVVASGYSDSFTGTNNTALATHDANWTIASGTLSNLIIYGNGLTSKGWVNTWAYYNASSADISQVTFLANDSLDAPQVCVRMGASQNGYCVYFDSASGGNYTRMVVEKNGGSAQYYTGLSYAQNANHTIKITASGTSTVTIHVFVDTADLGALTDSSSPLGAGHPGVALYSGSYDLSTTPQIDDWQDN